MTLAKLNTINKNTFLLVLLGAGSLIASPSDMHLRLLNAVYRSHYWERKTGALTLLLLLHGMLFLLLAILSYMASHKKTAALSRDPAPSRNLFAAFREEMSCFFRPFHTSREKTWIALTIAVGIGIRAYFLAQPMRYDEAYTYLHFADRGIADLFLLTVPNNHILHTILVKASVTLWGGHPAAIRIPAFLAGIGTIPLIFCLCRALNDRSGYLASITIAIFPYLVLFGTNARGYTLLVFFTLALAGGGLRFADRPSKAGVLIFSLSAALGMLTIPSMILPLSGVYVWLVALLLFRGRSVKRIVLDFLVPSAALIFIFSVLFYTPVLFVSNGIESYAQNHFVRPQPWQEFLGGIPSHFNKTLTEFSRDMPAIILLAFSIFVAAGLSISLKKGDWPSFLLLPAILAGSTLIFLAQHRTPFPRTWIYLLPIVVVVADIGFTRLIENISEGIQAMVKVCILGAAIFFVISLISRNSIAAYPDTGLFSEAPLIAKYLKSELTQNDAVGFSIPDDPITLFYLRYNDVPDDYLTPKDDPERIFYVVKKSMYSIEQMTQNAVIKLLDFDDAALYRSVEIKN